MYIPKRYGYSKIEKCPFCDKQATMKNTQGLVVCSQHKDERLPDIRCVCGTYLELKQGRYGPYFVCVNCGNINLNKGLDMMRNMQKKQKVETRKDKVISDPGKYPGFDYGVE